MGGYRTAVCAMLRVFANSREFAIAPSAKPLIFQQFKIGTVIAITALCDGSPTPQRGTNFQERVDAEDREVNERRSGLKAERSNERRKSNRVGNANDLRSGRSPHCLGVKRSNPRGPKRGQFSQAVRSGQRHVEELPSIYPRVARWCGQHLPITDPVAMSNAAKRLVVPWRL